MLGFGLVCIVLLKFFVLLGLIVIRGSFVKFFCRFFCGCFWVFVCCFILGVNLFGNWYLWIVINEIVCGLLVGLIIFKICVVFDFKVFGFVMMRLLDLGCNVFFKLVVKFVWVLWFIGWIWVWLFFVCL